MLVCPLFRRDKLDQFMEIYDPRLVGWGVDWWYIHVLGAGERRRFAIVDAVTCVNPEETDKGLRIREIDQHQSQDERLAIWAEIKEQQGVRIDDAKPVEWERVLRLPLSLCFWEAVILLKIVWGKIYRRLRRGFSQKND